jgi:hypothetical protein
MDPRSKSILRIILLIVAFGLALLAALALGGLFSWKLSTDLALIAGSLASYYLAVLVG